MFYLRHRSDDGPGVDRNLLIYSMDQSPSWEANWFCS